jgi:hypothetical protein
VPPLLQQLSQFQEITCKLRLQSLKSSGKTLRAVRLIQKCLKKIVAVTVILAIIKQHCLSLIDPLGFKIC